MNMPLRLTRKLSDDLWCHSSGGEHALKHFSDPREVINLANSFGRKIPLEHDELHDLMENDGLTVARPYLSDGGVGDAVGYAIADKINPSKIELIDTFVVPEYRGKGIAGYLLGKLVTGYTFEPHGLQMYVQNIPPFANYKGQDFLLPGKFISIYADEKQGTKGKFVKDIGNLIEHLRVNKVTALVDATFGGADEKDDTSMLVRTHDGEVSELDRTIISREDGLVLSVTNYLNGSLS